MRQKQEKENQKERQEKDRRAEERGGRHAWAYLLPEMWRTVTQRPVTLGFPRTPLDLPSGFRGHVVMTDADACRGCGLCARDCPAKGIELVREGRDRFRLIYHPDRCAYCGQCAESCPQDTLRLINAFTRPTFDRTDLDQILVDRRPEPEGDDGSTSGG